MRIKNIRVINAAVGKNDRYIDIFPVNQNFKNSAILNVAGDANTMVSNLYEWANNNLFIKILCISILVGIFFIVKLGI